MEKALSSSGGHKAADENDGTGRRNARLDGPLTWMAFSGGGWMKVARLFFALWQSWGDNDN